MDTTSQDGSPGAYGSLPVVTGLAGLADLVSEHDRLYLRYSKGPEKDRRSVSMDYESGLELPGLSVTVLTPEAWWTRPLEDWLARQVRKYASLVEEEPSRYGWVLRGHTTAHGPDHEPLLVEMNPIAYLADTVMEEAKSRYRSRFERGRKSTDG